MKKVAFYTLGCKVNQYDTQAMLELFLSEGYEVSAFDERADVYVVNTCTVTGTADKKSRQMISRAKRQNPGALVIAAGCLAQKEPEAFLQMGVDAVLGIQDRSRILELIREGRQNAVSDISRSNDFEELTISASGEKTRGSIKIQEGCNNYCSYCIIPYVRGPARSRELSAILEEAKRLVESGIKEIVLTGIHIDAYGIDRPDKKGLIDVMEAVGRIEGLQRMRLGSLEPVCFTDEFLKRAASIKTLCPHFHVSLQSGSDGVLKRMRRRYTAGEYAAYMEKIRRAFDNPAVTTDIIAGFPGETPEEHAETLAFVKSIGFSRVHVFPYSRREGTAAAAMPGQVPKAVRQARTAELIALGEESEKAYMQGFVGRNVSVLFETEDAEQKGNYTGYTERYVEVSAPGAENEIKEVFITGMDKGRLTGK
jgi:threonylcarbamoyladenosine tRNA methylthiotransferase MtaB